MLDVTLIRHHPDQVREGLRKRAVDVDIPAFLALDAEFREARAAVERLRGERRRISAEIAVRRRTDAPAGELRAEAKTLTDQLAEAEAELAHLAARHQEFLDALPNLPDADVAAGGKENNEVVRSVGAPPAFDFPARDHVRLAQDLGLVDYKRGTALAGNGHWIYRGEGAALEWALLNHFLDTHRRAGYEFVLPPHLLTYEAGYTAGQFPKFAEDVFVVEQGEGGRPERFLLPTAETALANLHRGETLDERELPRRYVAYTPCYRRESGSHRTAERGTLRGHQFNKVELFQFARPEHSDAAHLELLARAEELVADLGLHYRITKLAAGDTSPAQAKTYDVEVWLPSLGAYAEVSSVSNARAYQARRGGILPQLSASLEPGGPPSPGRRRQVGVRPHPQRLGSRDQPTAARDPGAASAGGRHGGRAGGAAAVGAARGPGSRAGLTGPPRVTQGHVRGSALHPNPLSRTPDPHNSGVRRVFPPQGPGRTLTADLMCRQE